MTVELFPPESEDSEVFGVECNIADILEENESEAQTNHESFVINASHANSVSRFPENGIHADGVLTY